MAKRKRDYRAEYARRIRNAEAKGRNRQAARGHKPKEHIERAERTRSRYGVSPAALTKLRSAALAHVVKALGATTKKPVNETMLRRGLNILHGEDLRSMVEIEDGGYFAGLAAAQQTQLAALSIAFPYSIEDIEDSERNPLWYH